MNLKDKIEAAMKNRWLALTAFGLPVVAVLIPFVFVILPLWAVGFVLHYVGDAFMTFEEFISGWLSDHFVDPLGNATVQVALRARREKQEARKRLVLAKLEAVRKVVRED